MVRFGGLGCDVCWDGQLGVVWWACRESGLEVIATAELRAHCKGWRMGNASPGPRDTQRQ